MKTTVLAALALLLGAVTPAFAHTTLIRSEPAKGSMLAASPSRILLVFNEELEPKLGRVSLIGPDGRTIALAPSGDPHDVNALIAPVDRLAPGLYSVKWHVVSADGHPVNGTFAFTVKGDSTVVPSPTPAVVAPSAPVTVSDDDQPAAWGPTAVGAPLIPAVLRGAALGATMLLAGLLLFVAYQQQGPSASTPATSRLVAAFAVAAPLLLVLHFGAWMMNAAPEHTMSADAISVGTSSGTGRIEMWRIGLALLALWAVALARRPRLACVFAFAALVVSGNTGHAAALFPVFATPAKSLHLVAGAAWIGGVLWLVTCDRTDRATFLREVSRVSRVALIAIIVVTLSGIIQTRYFLQDPMDVVRSSYGLLALTKLAGVFVLAGFGAHHRLRVLPTLAADDAMQTRFTATLRRELGVMAVLVFLGGLLAYVPTPPIVAAVDSPSHSTTP